MLAGAYIGVAVVLMFSVTGPLLAAASPWTKLIQGLVFGIALTLVVFAGAELSTGNMMTAIQGMTTGRAASAVRSRVILGSFVGNLVGSVVFAWLVDESGVLCRRRDTRSRRAGIGRAGQHRQGQGGRVGFGVVLPWRAVQLPGLPCRVDVGPHQVRRRETRR